MASIYDVSMLHDKMGHSKFRNESPGFLPDDFMKMRLNFMLEELLELANACGYTIDGDIERGALEFNKDEDKSTSLEEALDALVDLTYVTLGTADLMGFKKQAPGSFYSIWHIAWSRVQQANMKKEPVVNAKESSRGFGIDLKKPKGWLKPQFKDLLV